MNDEKNKLSGTTRLLHIIIALGMICMIAVGIYMSENEVYFLYDIHKSFGAVLFILALFRIRWRIKKGWPTAVSEMGVWQHRIARAVHWILITATVLYPVSGVIMSIGGGHGMAIFGLELVAETMNEAGKAIPVNEMAAEIGHEIHELLVPVIIIAILLHIVGALKHHFIDKDDTIRRMFSIK